MPRASWPQATRLMVVWSQGRLQEASGYENVYNDALVEMAGLCSQVGPDSPCWPSPEAAKQVNATEKKR